MDRISILAAAYGVGAWGLSAWMGAIAMTAVSVTLVGGAVWCWMIAAPRCDLAPKIGITVAGFVLVLAGVVIHVQVVEGIVWQFDDAGRSAVWIVYTATATAMALAALAAVVGVGAPVSREAGTGGSAERLFVRCRLVAGVWAASAAAGVLALVPWGVAGALGAVPLALG